MHYIDTDLLLVLLLLLFLLVLHADTVNQLNFAAVKP